jgi:hypothetical protein
MTPKDPSMLPDAWSFSAVNLYGQCQRKFYYERVLRLAPENNATQLPGLVTHKAIEEYFAPRAKGVPPLPNHTPTTVACTAVQQFLPDLVRCGINTDELIYEVTANLRKVESILQHTRVLKTEEKFAWCGFIGYIDLQLADTPVMSKDGKEIKSWKPEPCVIDAKVVSSSRSRSQRDADLSPQLALYGPLAMGYKNSGFMELPRDTEKPWKIRVATYEQREIDRWVQWFSGQAAAIEEQWEAAHGDVNRWNRCERKNPLCCAAWCHYWDMCYGSKGTVPGSQAAPDGPVRG